MKRIIAIFMLLVLISGCTSKAPEKSPADALKEEFSALREKTEEAGYEVRDSFVDAKFEGVVEAFSVKINFDANTVATIPVVLCESEYDADYNCRLLEGGIKLPIKNGCVFSYPGKDYPENVIAVVDAIVNGKEIPKNEFVK